MTAPAWFWPVSGKTARGYSLVAYGSGIAVPDWTQPVIWPFVSNAFGSPINIGSGSYGFGQSASDASGNVYSVTWDGVLWRQNYSGSSVSSVMPSGQVYIGTAYAGGSGFAVAASGKVYTSGAALLGSFPLPVRPVAATGSTIFGCMPASGIGTMNAGTGATGFIALPGNMTMISSIVAVSGQPVAVGGWRNAALLSGAAAAALDPQDQVFMLGVGSGNAVLWTAPGQYADAWSQAQAVTGLANLTAVAWRPDGTQALACSPASGVVQAIENTAGVLSLQQTLAVSGACSVAVTGDSVHALVAQSGQSQAAVLAYAGSTWATGAALGGLPGIVGVVPYGASGAVAATSGSLQYLNEAAGTWTSGATVPLGFSPTVLTVDSFNQVYAAGSGAVAMSSGGALIASGTWSGGSPSSIAVQQGRIVIAVPGDGLMRVFAYSASGVLSQQASTAIANSSTGLGLSTTVLFVMATSGTATYGFSGQPYMLTPVLSGAVAFWNGSWTTAGLGVGNMPTALGYDASGSVYVATLQNTLWHITSGGTVLSSGVLQQYPTQLQQIPLSVSSVLNTPSGVFAATSIPGVLYDIA